MSVPSDAINPVVYGVLGSGIVEIGGVSARWAYSEISDRLADGAGERLDETFEEALRDGIATADENSETGELGDVLEDWDEVWAALDADDLLTDEADDAAAAIVEAIGDAKGFDPAAAGVYPEMQEAASEAYATAIDAFHDEIEGTDLEATLSTRIDRALLRELRLLRDRLRGTKGYRVYDTDPDTLDGLARRIVKRGGGNPDVAFVDRDLDRPTASKTLIHGPGGAGKTRQMSEWVRALGTEGAIEHVVVPKESGDGNTLATNHAGMALKRESFEGDVLLVWDGVPPADSTAFEAFDSIVRSLQNRCTDLGVDHRVLATARTTTIDPETPAREHADTGLLASFDRVEVGDLDDHTADLVDAAIEAHDMTLGGESGDREAVREALIAKTRSAGGTPGYVEDVLTVADDPLTVDGIEDLPEDQRDLWSQQFGEIERAEYCALAVLKLCSDLRLPPFARLVEALGDPVGDAMDLDSGSIAGAITTLVHRGFVREVEPENGEGRLLHLHDVRAAAVEFESDRQRDIALTDVSDYLLEDMNPAYDLPDDFDRPSEIHNRAGIGFADSLGDNDADRAERHFERALDLDPEFPEAHNNYAYLLENQLDRPHDAEAQYRQAIDDNDGTYPEAHYNYALLLEEQLDYPFQAREQYEKAILNSEGTFARASYKLANLLYNELEEPAEAREHYERIISDYDGTISDARYNYALLFEEEFDWSDRGNEYSERKAIRDNDSLFAEVRYKYATLLKEAFDNVELAEDQYQRAIEDKEDTYPGARNNYALLLHEHLDRPHDAEAQYRKAIEDNDWIFPEARYNYARLLHEHLDRPHDAEAQYRQAIDDNDGTFPEARNNYARLLKNKLDRPNDAEEQYRKAIDDNDDTYPEARYNYALLLEEQLDRPNDAEDQYLDAILDEDGPFPEAEFNLGTLLESLDRLDEAADHIERAIAIWRRRGRLDNAIHEARALVRIHRQREAYVDAVETAVEAIDWCAQTDDDRLARFVEVLVDLDGEADPETLVRGAYRAGLRCVTAKRGQNAHRLFVTAFRHREACSGEPLRRARSAGVAIATLAAVVDRLSVSDPLADLAADDPDPIAAAMAEHAGTLRPPVADCLTLLTGDRCEGTDAATDQAVERLETAAFGRLSRLAM